MPGIFISYRRDDSAGHAGRLFDHLSRVFGADGVFMDVDDIERGDTFAETLTDRLRQSDVLLAVIGRRWLTLTDVTGRRRLDNADDWLRNEIGSALESRLLVIPVLVDGARVPATTDLPEAIRELAGRQVAELRDGSWSDDVARLCEDIKRRRARGSWSERLRRHRATIAIALLLAVTAGGYSAYVNSRGTRVIVPDVARLPLDRATTSLADAGLQVGPISRAVTNEARPGTVLGQTPPPRTTVGRGSAVALTVAEAKAVDLRQFVVIRDVGQEGTVAAAACATAMDASLAAQGHPVRLSMRYIYEKAKRHDEITGEGTSLETMIYVARQFGAPAEASWPYRPLDRRLPRGMTWRDLDEAATAYRATVTQLPGLDDVLPALDRRTPVLAVATVTDAWSSDAATRTGLIAPGEGDHGGTVITFVGYDPATRRFTFANNWGVEWGDRGFGYIDAADAARILQSGPGLWAVTVAPPGR